MNERSVRVERAGLHTLVVDRGRFGLRDRGIAWCGAMDLYALTVANALLGNDRGAAALEVTYGDLDLTIDSPARIAVAGADCSATLDGASIAPFSAFDVQAGARLRLRRPRAWVRTIVAFDGGIDVPPVLGSRTTDCMASMGGLAGRALRAGDVFHLGNAARAYADMKVNAPALRSHLRVIAEPGYDALWNQTWTIGHDSNRMGWRLLGTPYPHNRGAMPSRSVFPGVIQVPPSGEPIVLGSDAQTTGGYPIAGVVAEADLWMMAQIPHGGTVRFEPCTLEEAE